MLAHSVYRLPNVLVCSISPCIWGPLTDDVGRRPIYLITLLIFEGANLGLALTPNYGLLMFLRCLQASGSASVIAIGENLTDLVSHQILQTQTQESCHPGAGTIGDISVPAERAFYFGLFNIGALSGPALGPVLGGLLTKGFGWRSIFWFLLIVGGLGLAIIALLLPEYVMFLFYLPAAHTLHLPRTLRRLVGNGSLPPPSGFFGHALVDYLTLSGRRRIRQKREKGQELARALSRHSQDPVQTTDASSIPTENVEKAAGANVRETEGRADKVIEKVAKEKLARQRQSKWKRLNPFQPLVYLREPDVAIFLAFNALIYGE
jgi:Major Facilitator Superfamily